MTVINPRGGATLAQVVQAALNVAGNQGVSIVTGGTGNGVQVPDELVAAVEDALGWTAHEGMSTPTPATTHPTTQVVEPEPPHAPPTTEVDSATEDPAPPPPADKPVSKTSPKAAPKAANKTTTPRRARRGKEG